MLERANTFLSPGLRCRLARKWLLSPFLFSFTLALPNAGSYFCLRALFPIDAQRQLTYLRTWSTILLVIALWYVPGHMDAEQPNQPKLWSTHLINGHVARMQLDTGASHPVIFSNRLEALGLHLLPLPAEKRHQMPPWILGETDECSVVVNGDESRTSFLVVPGLPELYGENPADGLIGWPNFPDGRLFVCVDRPAISVMAPDERVAEVASWPMFRIDTNSGNCIVTKYLSKKHTLRLLIDTGAKGGVYLPPQKYAQWRKRHSQAPATIEGTYTLQDGGAAKEVAWAYEFDLGPLKLKGVPCTEDKRLIDQNLDASLGLLALRKLDLVLDRTNGIARITTCPEAANIFEDHNRLGALFIPRTESADLLTAVVASPTPASRADIQAGDVLLRVDDVDTASWRTNKAILAELRPLWRQPAGTHLTLKLKRGDEVLTKKIKLEDILPPRRKLSTGREPTP